MRGDLCLVVKKAQKNKKPDKNIPKKSTETEKTFKTGVKKNITKNFF